MDLQPRSAALEFIRVLVGGELEELQACTIAAVYPRWLPQWVSYPLPGWHYTELAKP